MKLPSAQVDGLQYRNGGKGVFVQKLPEGNTDEQSPTSAALARRTDASQGTARGVKDHTKYRVNVKRTSLLRCGNTKHLK